MESSPNKLSLHSSFVAVQLGFAGFQLLTKLALTSGISRFVFPVYRNALALALVGPLALFFEQKKRTSLSPKLIARFALLGFAGIFCNQVLYLAGLGYTSPTFAAAIQNAAPAFTFVLAVACGLETVRWNRRDGQAIVIGIILSVAGAVVMSLFEGPAVMSLKFRGSQDGGLENFNMRILFPASLPQSAYLKSSFGTWQIGALCLLGANITWAIFLTLQASILKVYPAPLSVSASTNFFGMVELLLLAVICERNPSKWALKWGPQVAGVAYAGIIASGLILALQTWCIQRGGPVLAAVYQPVETIAVAILSFLFLGETLHLGSLVGGIVIITGLYLVAWGESERLRLALIVA